MRSPTDEEDSENEENYQSCSDDAEDVKTAPHSSQRRFKKETMRDVLISMVLLGLTTLVTHGDFQTSPTASILASGTNSKGYFPKRICVHYFVLLATKVNPIMLTSAGSNKNDLLHFQKYFHGFRLYYQKSYFFFPFLGQN